ncbi:MAG: lysoplasmalogenase family protein, partial [Sphaerochaetaceae bacterium]
TFLFFYLIISFAHLSFRSEGYKLLGDVTKILLMPTLGLYVMQHGSSPLLVGALCFATIGDALLTKGHQGRHFLWGMGSFGLCHFFYISYILLVGVDWILTAIAIAALLIPYGLLVRLIGKQKGSVKYLVYAALLAILAALCTGLSSLYCILGILLFIVSDTLIGLDSLDMKKTSNTSEMGSYILAQLFLILGLTAL